MECWLRGRHLVMTSTSIPVDLLQALGSRTHVYRQPIDEVSPDRANPLDVRLTGVVVKEFDEAAILACDQKDLIIECRDVSIDHIWQIFA